MRSQFGFGHIQAVKLWLPSIFSLDYSHPSRLSDDCYLSVIALLLRASHTNKEGLGCIISTGRVLGFPRPLHDNTDKYGRHCIHAAFTRQSSRTRGNCANYVSSRSPGKTRLSLCREEESDRTHARSMWLGTYRRDVSIKNMRNPIKKSQNKTHFFFRNWCTFSLLELVALNWHKSLQFSYPVVPRLYCVLEIHKPDRPMRPIVSAIERTDL